MIKVDGHWYNDKSEAPDLGSLVCVSVNRQVRSYEGLSKDISKLPKYDDLATGSSAYFIDTVEYYKYEATTKQWYKQ